jgi:hypothetical protein
MLCINEVNNYYDGYSVDDLFDEAAYGELTIYFRAQIPMWKIKAVCLKKTSCPYDFA